MSEKIPLNDEGAQVDGLSPVAARALIEGLQDALPVPDPTGSTEISNIIRGGNDLNPLPQQIMKRISWMALPLLIAFATTSLLLGHAAIKPVQVPFVFNPNVAMLKEEAVQAPEPTLTSAEMQRLVATVQNIPTDDNLTKLIGDSDDASVFTPLDYPPSWWITAIDKEKSHRVPTSKNNASYKYYGSGK